MEALINKAEYIIDKSHETLIRGGCGNLLAQPLFRKLAEIYAEEAVKSPRLKSISLTHKLLEKLVKRDSLNCLVVNLYRGNEGYSLIIRLGSGVETETVRLQYEDEEFFSYIDNEELPPMLLDLLDEANVDIFYSGCIITEIRDYRRSLDSYYESKFILLKPTNQSLVADIASLTRDKDWTPAEKLQLESEIVRRTAPPLNLSPSPIVALINNKVHQHKYKFSGVPLRRAARRFSQVAQNRQKRFEEGAPPAALKLHGFLSDRKDKRPLARTISKPSIPMTTEELAPAPLLEGKDKFYQRVTEDVKKVAQPLDRVQDTSDNSLVLVEEYTLETERGQGRIYLTKLTLSQRRTDEVYFGELYVDRDYQDGKQNGSICRFQLGTLYQVQRYIKQFKEILTEEGRKTVKITHKVAGQPPRVAHTPGMRDKKDLAEQLKQQQQQQTQATQQQVQQIKQGLITSFNLGTQQTVTLPISSGASTGTVVAGGVNFTQGAAQNVIIVSNADGTKKSVNVMTKPITVTSGASLSSLLSAQSSPQQTVGQQLVVGQSLNLTNLLNSRQVVTNRGGTVTAISGPPVTVSGPVTQATKVAVNVSSGTKLAMPTLAAQLTRPAPAYSQVVSGAKMPQAIGQVGSVSEGVSQSQIKPENPNPPPMTNANSNLQALLAGSSTENSTITRNATLIEKLTATSAMLNSAKLQDDPPSKIGTSMVSIAGASSHHTTSTSTTTSASALIRAAEATGGSGPPNINLANINLPGLNVGLQNLATSIPGIQNVQVSIPGFPVPISLSLNVPGSTSSNSSSAIIVTSPSQLSVVSKTSGTTSVSSSAATVMIASHSGLQQRQVVQLPFRSLVSANTMKLAGGAVPNPVDSRQINGSQLAAQLTKSNSQGTSGTSNIPVLQVLNKVQGLGGSLFAPVRNNQATVAGVTATSTGALAQQTVQVAVPASQGLSSSGGEMSLGALTTCAGTQIGSSIVTFTSKQPLAMSKQPSGQLTWQLQQKLMAAKRQQQLQQQQQQQQQQQDQEQLQQETTPK